MGNPFATVTEIAKRHGYLKNTRQTQNILDRLVDSNLVHRAHWWEKTVYFLDKSIPCELLNTSNYLRIKELVFSKLNQLESEISQLEELKGYYKISDFTAIPKKKFCKLPLPYPLGLNDKNKIGQITLKYIQRIFLETHIRILEDNFAEQNNINELRCGSKKQFREARLFYLFSSLKIFLDKNWNSTSRQTDQELTDIVYGLDLDYKAAQMFHSNLSKRTRHSGYNVKAMIADKMGYKWEFAENNQLKLSTLTKTTKKFNNKGWPDFGLMYRYRCVEDASDFLNSAADDISWYSFVAAARDEINSSRFLDKSTQKQSIQRIKRVFPKMQIF